MKAVHNVREFNLPKPSGSIGLEIAEALLAKVDEIAKSVKTVDPGDVGSGLSKEDGVKLGANLFQVEKALSFALEDPERFSSFSRTMSNKLKQTFQLLAENKIEVINHTGDEYFPTMKIEVLSFETDENISKPTISETIDPTIYFNGEMVKMGKVIVTQKTHTHET